ncbi:MAG: alkyl sulfatase dimerization domain-containing protein [Candidatus Pelagadaptatus aseana]|uniref:alkyl/aryl-sulfatase n=1 Tax=Candidatus Pelagadaptatus aseana TaxID=3120508 RepID=UPI0039B1EDDD
MFDKKRVTAVLVALTSLVFLGCEQQNASQPQSTDSHGFTAATDYTIRANAKVAKELPLSDQQDFEQARRGLIAQADSLVVTTEDGRTVWDQTAYEFVNGEVPPTVNPSLWRQEQLNNIHGLFQVVPGIYQLRGFDLANMTLIAGDSGWIVVDPLTTEDTARYAMAFAAQHLGDKPVSAIVFTHSHIDHFGGVAGVLGDASAADIPIIAPIGFMEEAVSENILAGLAMERRAQFMYGRNLPVSERGHIGTGLGKEPAKAGKISILQPNVIVDRTGQTLTIDGVDLEFQNAPGSEAPAELTFYLPQFKAFCGGEVVSRNMHNLYTLRGAKVRDALAWSQYIDEALTLFGDRSDVYFGTHQWPIWGQENIQTFIKRQRDTYKFIHDQTLRLANRGATPREISEQLNLPSTLQGSFANRGYYGTLSHNAKAVYQMYFGWYDANPANLNPLPPVQQAERYVTAMGGAAKVLELAVSAFDKGDYRWAAELLNHLVFAEPDNPEARGLLANSYDQLGYQSESAPWRDVYLSAAYELRHGVAKTEKHVLQDAEGLFKAVPSELFFAAMATSLNGDRADGEYYLINIHMTDTGKNYVLEVDNSVLHHRQSEPDPEAQASIHISRDLFVKAILGGAQITELMGDELSLEGSRLSLIGFFRLFDKPASDFNIVTP